MFEVSSLWAPDEVRAVMPATPEEVFSVIADPTTYPDWLLGAKRIRRVDPSFPAAGSAFDHSVGVHDQVTVDDRSEVLDVDAPHRLVLEVHVGLVRGLVEMRVLEHPGGSEVRFRERPDGLAAVLTPVVRPLIHARNARSLQKLAQRFAG